jgi:hypothetical protein
VSSEDQPILAISHINIFKQQPLPPSLVTMNDTVTFQTKTNKVAFNIRTPLRTIMDVMHLENFVRCSTDPTRFPVPV